MNLDDLPRFAPIGSDEFTGTDGSPIAHLTYGGSRAYGLDHAGSDRDYAGFCIIPNSRMLGLHPITRTSWAESGPGSQFDISIHEIAPFLALTASSPKPHESIVGDNLLGPTLPLVYTLRAGHHRILAQKVCEVYCRLASGYMDKAEAAEPGVHAEKMARNVYRCMSTAWTLADTGRFEIRPDRETAFSFGEEPLADSRGWLNSEHARVEQAKSNLRPKADLAWLNELLLDFRAEHG